MRILLLLDEALLCCRLLLNCTVLRLVGVVFVFNDGVVVFFGFEGYYRLI